MNTVMLRDELRLRRDFSVIRIRQVSGPPGCNLTPDIDHGWFRFCIVISPRGDGSLFVTCVDRLSPSPPPEAA